MAVHPIQYGTGVIGVSYQTTNAGTTAFTRTPGGSLVSTRTGSGSLYYLTDNQGSVIGLVDGQGQEVAGYAYDPYGVTRTITGTSGGDLTQANANPYRYTGGYLDTTSNLNKLGYRYYDTLQGRFTQQDPSGQESNLFAYTGGDPVNFKDLSGKSFLSVVNGISAGSVGEGVNIGCQVGALTLVEEGCAGVGIVSGVAVNEGLTAVDSAIGAS